MEIGGNYSKCNTRTPGARLPRIENASAQNHLSDDARRHPAMRTTPEGRRSGRRLSRIETSERRAASRDIFQAEFVAQILGQAMGANAIAANIVIRAYEHGHGDAMRIVGTV